MRTAFIQFFGNAKTFSIHEKPPQLFINSDPTKQDERKNIVENGLNCSQKRNQIKLKKMHFPLKFGNNRNFSNQMNSNLKSLNRVGDMDNFDFS